MIKNLEQELREGAEAIKKEEEEKRAAWRRDFWEKWNKNYNALLERQGGRCKCGAEEPPAGFNMLNRPKGKEGRPFELVCDTCLWKTEVKAGEPEPEKPVQGEGVESEIKIVHGMRQEGTTKMGKLRNPDEENQRN